MTTTSSRATVSHVMAQAALGFDAVAASEVTATARNAIGSNMTMQIGDGVLMF